MAIPVFKRGPGTIIAYIPVFHGTWPDYSSLITMLHLVKQVSRYIHAMLKLVLLADKNTASHSACVLAVICDYALATLRQPAQGKKV